MRESEDAFRVFRDGLAQVLPVEVLSLFSPQETEQLVAGSSSLDVNVLRQCAEYENTQPDRSAESVWVSE